MLPAQNPHCTCGAMTCCCEIPLPETVRVSDGAGGTALLSWNGSQWTGNASGGFCGCGSAVLVLICQRIGVACIMYMTITPPSAPQFSSTMQAPSSCSPFSWTGLSFSYCTQSTFTVSAAQP